MLPDNMGGEHHIRIIGPKYLVIVKQFFERSSERRKLLSSGNANS
jgi:hypothetical protein